MTDILADGKTASAAPSDGLAVLEQKRSTAETFGIPLAVLAEIGVLQIHFSGGEPTARRDLVELVQHATDVGLYSNLITSAVLLTKEKLSALADAGLCHVQISFQGNEPIVADRVAG